ncbi:MAG: hypothetical protein ACRC6E_03745 [Fusobacteriaceae bacterium]
MKTYVAKVEEGYIANWGVDCELMNIHVGTTKYLNRAELFSDENIHAFESYLIDYEQIFECEFVEVKRLTCLK